MLDVKTGNALKGFRIGFLVEVETSDIREAGADLLSFSKAPTEQAAFLAWWTRENMSAIRDKVQIVVVKSYDDTLRKSWLREIEEEEWYGDEERPTRVRFTTFHDLTKTLYYGEPLKDDWGDEIDRPLGEASQMAHSLERTRRAKKQLAITRYIQHRYIRRVKHRSSDNRKDVASHSLKRIKRVTKQSLLTRYFQHVQR